MITVLLLSPSLDVTYLVDAVTPGAIHRPLATLRLAGGKGLNLARAAVTLGGDARVVAPLGGRIGDLVDELARADGIDLARVPVAAETRSCVTVVADDGPGVEFYEPATDLTDDELRAVEQALAASPLGGWTVLSGSVPASIPSSAVRRAIRARSEAGERIAVDTHGAVLRDLVDDVRPELVKVNRSEASALLDAPESASALDLARSLRDRTDGTVIVTDGVDGSACVSGDAAFVVAPHRAPGRFAVGSGDSFLAGLLVGLESGATLDDALALASAAASANATVPGAALLSLDAVAAERREVRVTPA